MCFTIWSSTEDTAKKRSAVWQMYAKPPSSRRIFCRMKVATVRDSSVPVSMMRRHMGMISVCSRKATTSGSSTFTSAPITPSEVRRRYSKGLPRPIVAPRNG